MSKRVDSRIMALSQRLLKRYEENINRLVGLEDDDFQELTNALGSVSLNAATEALVSELKPKVQSLSQAELEEILPFLLSLLAIRDQVEASTLEVAEDIAYFSTSAEGDNQSTVDRFTKLLNLNSLNVISKSGSLLFNNEHFMRRTQILTDIRPVFGDAIDESPEAALVLYTLKLSYFSEGDTKEFYVAMDENDLRDLADQVRRAKSKAESLKTLINNTGVQYVGSDAKVEEDRDDESH